ncbi:hypothetical protein M404DRAFT_316154 [Pisolithus tinctorius Marx 270]|uniref:Uncharacterized protein n=1 Tax=Pisolithus tinctorius Marx 270 TaxID=870435 RepID=A0A0C3JCP9_PISTI|nr:hypothetical protein M404DRAFT_316154 [Pisolithus tinctorius Marx 270]
MLHSFARIQILRRLACRYVKGDPWWLRNYISRIASSDELEFREMVRVPIVLYTRCCKATMHEAEERSMMTGTGASATCMSPCPYPQASRQSTFHALQSLTRRRDDLQSRPPFRCYG